MSLRRSTEADYQPLLQDNDQEHLHGHSSASGESQAYDENSPILDPSIAQDDTRIRWVFLVLGCATLMPWNVMITATPFFLSRLAGSPYQPTFSSYLSTTFTAANFGFLAHATLTLKQAKPSRRIHVSLLALTSIMAILTLSTFLDLSGGFFFFFVIISGILASAAGSYVQGAAMAVASLFGPSAVQATITGQAAVAVAVSGVQVISSAIFVSGQQPSSNEAFEIAAKSAEQSSARAFFALSTIFLVLTAFGYQWLVRTPAYTTLAAPLEHKTAQGDNDSSGVGSSDADSKLQILRVAKTNVAFEFAVCYVFIVTLAVFPPITISVKPTNPNTHPLLFTAVHFLMFNIGDFSGRYICSFPQVLIWSSRKLVALSLGRTLFVPLFLMCNIQRPSAELPISPIISSDLLFMLLLLTFGVTNGYISSLSMMSAASLEHNPRLKGRKEDVDIAATVATFALVAGLALGSIGSFAVRAAICGCNPFVH